MKTTTLSYELVSVNGIIQSVGNYSILNNGMLKFHRAPGLGDRVSISVGNAQLNHEGNGSRTVFEMPNNEAVKFEQFMSRVWEYRNNPTVRDQLEKLKIVTELIR